MDRNARFFKNKSKIAANGEGDGILYSNTGIRTYDGGYIEIPLNVTIGNEELKEATSLDQGWEHLGGNLYKGTNVTGDIKNISNASNGTFVVKAHIYHMETIDGSMSFEGFTYDAVRTFEKTTTNGLSLHGENFTGYVEILSVKRILFVNGQVGYFDLDTKEWVYIGENGDSELPYTRTLKLYDAFVTGITYLETRAFIDSDKALIAKDPDILMKWGLGEDVGFSIGPITENDHVFTLHDEPATIYEVSGSRPSAPSISQGATVEISDMGNGHWELLTRNSDYLKYTGPDYGLGFLKINATDVTRDLSYKTRGYVSTLDISSDDLDTINLVSFAYLTKMASNTINRVSDLERMDTRNGKYFNYTFYGIDSNTDLSNLDMGNAISFKYTFNATRGNGDFNFNEWDIGNLQIAEWPFEYMSVANFPDISRWNPVRLQKAWGFPQIHPTETVAPDISRWNLLSLKDGQFMYSSFSGITEAPDLSLHRYPSLETGGSMFANWRKITTPPNLDNAGFGNLSSASSMFAEWNEVTTPINTTNWQLSKLGTLMGMFANWFKCQHLIDITPFTGLVRSNYTAFLKGWSSITEAPGLEGIKIDNYRNYSNLSEMMMGWKSIITAPNIDGWITSAVSSISHIMDGWESITDGIDVHSWDLRQLLYAQAAFKNWKSAKTPANISGWNTPLLRNTTDMFAGWESLETPIDVSNLKTGSIYNADRMFYNWKKVATPPNVSTWTMSSLQTCDLIFAYMETVTEPPDVSNWQTSRLYKANGVFKGMKSLTTPPDVSSWDTSSLIYASEIFADWTAMGEITSLGIENWDISRLQNCSGFLRGATLSVDYYDTVLLAWEQQITSKNLHIPEIDFGNSKYTANSDASDARQRMIDAGINILDGGAA